MRHRALQIFYLLYLDCMLSHDYRVIFQDINLNLNTVASYAFQLVISDLHTITDTLNGKHIN
jgi:hypothetical protein